METTGKLLNATRDIMTGKLNITFQIESFSVDEINALHQTEEVLDIVVRKHKKKRSLDANGLLWHCIGQIASTLRTDKWEVYLQMLRRYGQFTYICVKPKMVDAVKLQWRECEVVGEVDINGQKAVQMLVYFGSSTYNTQEFSVLLDGVISEMKEIGLQPPASEEMRRALEQWEKMHERKE